MNRAFKGLLESLKPKLQEGALTQDNDHQYNIRLEGYLVMVDLLPDEEKILQATSLGALPKDNLCELYQTMLQGGNTFISKPQGQCWPLTTVPLLPCCKPFCLCL